MVLELTSLLFFYDSRTDSKFWLFLIKIAKDVLPRTLCVIASPWELRRRSRAWSRRSQSSARMWCRRATPPSGSGRPASLHASPLPARPVPQCRPRSRAARVRAPRAEQEQACPVLVCDKCRSARAITLLCPLPPLCPTSAGTARSCRATRRPMLRSRPRACARRSGRCRKT